MGQSAFRNNLTSILTRYANVPAKEAVVLTQDVDEVTVYATEAELLADTPTAGTLAFAADTGSIYVRGGSTWLASSPADSTQEALVLTVSPSATGLRSVVPGVRLSTQAQVTSWGAFATVGDAIKVLPPHIKHAVTINITPGAYSVADTFFGDWSAMRFGPNGSIAVDGGGTQQVSGTVTSAVASLANGFTITTAANPGYSADAFVGYFLKPVGGFGAGGPLRGIVRHSVTDMRVAGTINWNNTTTFQVWEPKTELTFSGPDDFSIVGSYSVDQGWVAHTSIRNLRLKHAATVKYLVLSDPSVELTNIQFVGVALRVLGGSVINGGVLTFDGLNSATFDTAIYVSGANVSYYNNTGSVVLYRWGYGLEIYAGSYFYIPGVSHRDGYAFMYASGAGTSASMAGFLNAWRTDTITDVAVDVSFGAMAAVSRANATSGAQRPTGTAGDARVGYDNLVSFATIDAVGPPTDDTYQGAHGCTVGLITGN